MIQFEMLEEEKYWCENCSNWDKEQVQMDGYAKCKLTGTLCFAQESGKECKFFNVSAENVIVSPCKVGQTVYSQKGCFFLPYEKDINPKGVIPCEVIAIKQTRWGKYILLKPLLIETYGMRSSNEWFTFSAIGKTVFLTREEAEQALKGSEG